MLKKKHLNTWLHHNTCVDVVVNSPFFFGDRVQQQLLHVSLLCLDPLLNLDTMLIELKHKAADWKKLGGHLGFSDSDMEIFQHATQGVDFDCLVELFEVWLKKTKKPTRRLIADALKSMGEEDLAQEILNIYRTSHIL